MSGRSRAAVLLAAVVTLGAVLVPSAQAAPRAPDTAVLDGARLQQTKLRLDRGDPQLRRAVRGVDGPRRQLAGPGPLDGRRQAEARARRRRPRLPQPGPLLVALPAPDRRQPLGLPVRPARRRAQPRGRHRHRPPGRREGLRLRRTTSPWPGTTRAGRQYAEKAAQVLRTWFLDPATRMNPNLNHAQFIPCKYDGRAIGIIDFSQSYTSVLDALALLGHRRPRLDEGRPDRHDARGTPTSSAG